MKDRVSCPRLTMRRILRGQWVSSVSCPKTTMRRVQRAQRVVFQEDNLHTGQCVMSKDTAAGDRFDRSRGRSIESIDSIDSIIFRSLAKFLKNRSRRDDRFRQKIVKIRAILAIFRPFEDFGDFRFDRFDIFFDSIDTEPNDRWGPPCSFYFGATKEWLVGWASRVLSHTTHKADLKSPCIQRRRCF